jgi:putative peptide zinc metalloprotease protein
MPPQPDWIAPPLGDHWQLGKSGDGQYYLQTPDGQHRHSFCPPEAHALRHFIGRFTLGQIQAACRKQFGPDTPPTLVTNLVTKLLVHGILTTGEIPESPSDAAPPAAPQGKPQLALKPNIHWVEHPDGYWILRNPEDVTYMQVGDLAKQVIDDLGQQPLPTIAQKYAIDPLAVRSLLQQLAATAMLVGTTPPQPVRGKFKPTDLLYFKFSLFNPDPFLNRTLPALRWLWTRTFIFVLAIFLSACTVIGLNQWRAIAHTGAQLWQSMGPMVLLPFGLLAMAVVTIHELGHAYTLKHYGGIVPDIGLMFMFLMPAAYTNTTDQYALVKRSQRIWVVAAGVLCQFTIASIALCLWNLSVPDSWLFKASYLLMVAALFTVALNLNPLARFDGYYLAIALTGVNNLKSRSFLFYKTLLQGLRCQEPHSIRWILALYAPFSLCYLVLVFGKLFAWLVSWTLLNAPILVTCLLLLWAIYYYLPHSRSPADA